MTETNFTIGGKPVSYQILSDGYMIYIEGVPSIHQYEPFIPYPDLGYEGSCVQQITDLCDKEEAGEEVIE